MNMDQWEWTSFLVRSALKNNYNLLDQVVHRSSPVIQLIKSRTEQSIFVEIGPYIAKFGPYFIDYSRQSILLLDILVDQFATGPDHGLDHFFLDWTTHWTAFFWTRPHTGLPNISNFLRGVKNKGLKMDRSGPF